ncbi:MAG: DUF892 family protein [Flavobacteriaceae bacterium]
MQTVGAAFASDEIVKNLLAAYAFEQAESVCYRSLDVACEAVGDGETAAVCRQIQAEEEAMAGLLWQELPQTVRLHLSRMQAAAPEARR